MFHNLAEDIVFVLIRLKILDIEQRDYFISVIERVLLSVSILIAALAIALLFNWFIGNAQMLISLIMHAVKAKL